jgi:hypothetical protein
MKSRGYSDLQWHSTSLSNSTYCSQLLHIARIDACGKTFQAYITVSSLTAAKVFGLSVLV